MSKAAAISPGDPALATLRRELHERLLTDFDFESVGQLSQAQLVAECTAQVNRLLDRSTKSVPEEARVAVVRGVLDDVFGLGPLEPLIADPEVSDVLVTAPDRVFVERRGRLELTGAAFRDRGHLLHVIHRIVRNAGRRVDERSPMVDARLPDGSRVNAVIPPLAVDGPQLSIRRFPPHGMGIERLVELGTLAPATAAFIRAAVAGRLNLVISGGAGVGKTTLLNAASVAIGPTERVITIEDAAELRLQGTHVVRLETRPSNVEGVGSVETRDLVRNSLRMRPDRIIVGECRGAEAFDMLQAMNSGHDGSMTTLHANAARDSLRRLESMLAMGSFDMPVRVIREYVASAIEVVVHLARLPDGRRVVSEVIEVGDALDDGIEIRPIHRFRSEGVHDGRVTGRFEATGEVPRFLERLRQRGIDLDPALFRAGPLPAGVAA